MGKYFGTDGFRGEAGITLTADHAYKVGRFLGWYYNALRERNGDNEPARIVIGKDTRRSSYMFEYSLVAGLTASGADAYLLHVTTTPSVAYIARVDDFDCGIMISASHNPYYDNGIKLIDCYGEKMPEETLLLVEDYIDGKLHVFDKDWPELPFAHREHIGCTVDYVAGRNRYMGYLISLGIYSFKGVKVGLDCANGSSWNIAKSVFDALGADTYVINNQPNGLNINNNAGSTHIEGLKKFVVEKGLDVGFAYDGDADRCLCVDEKGNVITGDHILYIYGCYMKERGKLLTNTVVTTVMSNFGLYKAFDEQGIGYAKTAVGDKYVYEYMAKNGCRIGGEQSGHIIFSKYASTGDGILTSLKMMEVMLAKKKPMSELAAPLKIYPQVLENVRVTDKKTAQNDPAVQEAVSRVAEALGDTGRIKILSKILTNILTALYQPFGFSLLLSFFAMFFYLYAYHPTNAGNGWKSAIVAWWQEFKRDCKFRKLFVLAFVTSMILFRTLLNRNLWMNLLSNVMGGWGIWETVNGERTLTTECIENVILMMPFTGMVMWTFDVEKRVIWKSTKLGLIFSVSIEMLQLLLRLGTFQLSDIFYNTVGGMIGGLMCCAVMKARKRL